ncbi:MAG: 3-deoxy-7-phosphoheptulonate synthase [Candidatus Omnitrophica bacterium]|nr:3-deoxy-7-phosphoheptulonate synthase [Candidatus Omnitrophota bacterium]
MIIVLKPDITQKQVDHILDRVRAIGLKPMVSKGVERTIIGVIGDENRLRTEPLSIFPGVEKVLEVTAPYKLVSREFRPANSIIHIGDVSIGGKKIVTMAGPCTLDCRENLFEVARKVKKAGAGVLRGSAFRPSSAPVSVQGLGEEGLVLMREACDKCGLKMITEVMSINDVELVAKYADILQVGARNMQNYNLLSAVGQIKKPVVLQRGLASMVKEWLLAAEYIAAKGNTQIIFCERGIRTFESETQFTLDLSVIPIVKQYSHLPVVVEPSHAVGKWGRVLPMALAAVAAGADGLILEVHAKPEESLSCGPHALLPRNFSKLMRELQKVAQSVGRDV